VGQAVAKVALATLLFSFNPLLFARIHLDPLELFWTANVFSALVVGLLLAIGRRGPELVAIVKTRPVTLVLLSIAFVGNNLLYISALRSTTIANSVLTHYAAPALVFVMGAVWLKEHVGRRALVALGLAFAGLVLLLNPAALIAADRHTAGILLGLGSAVFYAEEIVLKKILVDDHPPLSVVFMYLAVSIVALAPFVAWRPISSASGEDVWWLAASGIGASALGITLFMSGLKDIRAQQASVISYIEPLAAIVWGMMFMAETPGYLTLVGGLLILGGTYLIVIERRPARG
jgi:drug/metabolite transporter (DMT)-like permease